MRQQDRLIASSVRGGTTRYTAVTASSRSRSSLARSSRRDRLGIWAAASSAGSRLLTYRAPAGRPATGRHPTDSLVERFGLFTIIVLGEVVFGVVEGLSGAERDLKTVGTGMLALGLGFGFWWIYFDIVGGRFPKADGRSCLSWTLGHLPITMAIAAAAPRSIGLIAHAHDASRARRTTALLLGGAVALGLLAEIPTMRALADADRLRPCSGRSGSRWRWGRRRPCSPGSRRPTRCCWRCSWRIFTAIWFFAVSRYLRSDAWSEPGETSSEAA